jgi:hypothetical protein
VPGAGHDQHHHPEDDQREGDDRDRQRQGGGPPTRGRRHGLAVPAWNPLHRAMIRTLEAWSAGDACGRRSAACPSLPSQP